MVPSYGLYPHVCCRICNNRVVSGTTSSSLKGILLVRQLEQRQEMLGSQRMLETTICMHDGWGGSKLDRFLEETFVLIQYSFPLLFFLTHVCGKPTW